MAQKLLTIDQTCRRLDVSERTFRRMVADHEFPQPVRRGARWVRVPASDVDAYLAKLLERRPAPTP